MKKTKHNLPQKSKPNFIKFSKVQQRCLNEVRIKQFKEFSEILGLIYEELGIAEKILNSPLGTYIIRKDYSGLDVLPIPKKGVKIAKSLF